MVNAEKVIKMRNVAIASWKCGYINKIESFKMDTPKVTLTFLN